MDRIIAAAVQFASRGEGIDVREHGSGNVHQTYLVTEESEANRRFILQRVNTRVFRQPELVMHNVHFCTDHVQRRLRKIPPPPGRRWEVPVVLTTGGGLDHWIDPEGGFWRAQSFIEGARAFDTLLDEDHAGELGYALGMFHDLVGDIPADRLTDTLPGFHVTPLYLRHYDEVSARGKRGRSPELAYALRFVADRRKGGDWLEEGRRRGRLSSRIIHGDPKVNNVMISSSTRQAVGMIDLDTIRPGLIHYDIGDCLRSGCNPMGEETPRWETVHFATDHCRAILRGYFSSAGSFLTPWDLEYLYGATRLIAFELGLRFLTDYLEGSVYFKASHPEHNLIRALVQFKLVESIEAQERIILTIIDELKIAAIVTSA